MWYCLTDAADPLSLEINCFFSSRNGGGQTAEGDPWRSVSVLRCPIQRKGLLCNGPKLSLTSVQPKLPSTQLLNSHFQRTHFHLKISLLAAWLGRSVKGLEKSQWCNLGSGPRALLSTPTQISGSDWTYQHYHHSAIVLLLTSPSPDR